MVNSEALCKEDVATVGLYPLKDGSGITEKHIFGSKKVRSLYPELHALLILTSFYLSPLPPPPSPERHLVFPGKTTRLGRGQRGGRKARGQDGTPLLNSEGLPWEGLSWGHGDLFVPLEASHSRYQVGSPLIVSPWQTLQQGCV